MYYWMAKVRFFCVIVLLLSVFVVGCQSKPIKPQQTQIAPIRTQIAEQLLSLNHIDAAKKQLDMALQADANYAPAYRVMAMVYQSSQELSDQHYAKTLFEQAIKIDDNDMQSQLAYGLFLLQMGDEAGALQQFDKPSTTIGYEGRLVAIENIAFIYYQQYQRTATARAHHKVKAALERAIKAGSTNTSLRDAYAKILQQQALSKNGNANTNLDAALKTDFSNN